MSVVSVKMVPDYDGRLIRSAVMAHFEALSVPRDIEPDMNILIKPNLLSARKPELAVTTHYELVSAVVSCLKELGAQHITIADSSGGVYNEEHMRSVYAASGLRRPELEEYLNHDFTYREVATHDGFAVRSFNLITPVSEADYIISLPKLKTHSMTTMSCAVKNLFGTIPGLQKPDMHCRFPELGGFVRMLCELAVTVSPNVTIVDAVDSMEGNGPNGGTVKRTGLTAASRDVFSLDWALAEFMGLVPEEVPHLKAALELGLTNGDVDYEGDGKPAPDPFRLPDSVKRPSFMDSVPPVIAKLAIAALNRLVRSFPRVDRSICIGCGRCAESCPQHIIKVTGGKAEMTRNGCISCFCCQEMCPVRAISAKRMLNL